MVIPHAGLPTFQYAGNSHWGLATTSMGARAFEIWRFTSAPGAVTLRHRHESEETFIVSRGKGEIQVGDRRLAFEAPATVIAPAGMPHQVFNTGDELLDAIVVVSIGSTIWSPEGQVMELPWRK